MTRKYVHQLEDGKWYYLDETSDFNGPYDTEREAKDMFQRHIEWLNLAPKSLSTAELDFITESNR
jgi:hypothetical protein